MTLEEFLRDWNDPSPTLTVHTSGSTGKPKPMQVEKQRMLNSARITCDFLALKPGDRALLCMPLDYIAGKMMVVRSIERGLHLVSVTPSGHPYESLSETERQTPFDLIAMVPLQVFDTLQDSVQRQWLMGTRHLIIGGGAIDSQLESQLREFPNYVWSTYGMTETLSHIALRRLNGPEASLWYTPFDSVQVSTDADGCLVIHAPLVHDGLLTTHDRVELRQTVSNGRPLTQFRILGRKDNVICSGGLKIQIEEVEAKLRPHLTTPFLITRCADRKFGECVVLLTESDDLTSQLAVCRKVLPKYWVPHKAVHVDHIPLTATGKPARAEAERLAAGK